jgi:DNA sulfur modification protein DndC
MIRAIRRITKAYMTDPNPWVVAYSGGKDSTAVLKLLFAALSRCERPNKLVTVVYCQTGMEIPLIVDLALTTLSAFATQAQALRFPVDTAVISPPLQDRFLVKLLGKGYPPPTDKFRWCTDRLAINPISAFLKRKGHDKATIVVGVRKAESATRSLTLKQNGKEGTQGRSSLISLIDPVALLQYISIH